MPEKGYIEIFGKQIFISESDGSISDKILLEEIKNHLLNGDIIGTKNVYLNDFPAIFKFDHTSLGSSFLLKFPNFYSFSGWCSVQDIPINWFRNNNLVILKEPKDVLRLYPNLSVFENYIDFEYYADITDSYNNSKTVFKIIETNYNFIVKNEKITFTRNNDSYYTGEIHLENIINELPAELQAVITFNLDLF